MWIVSSHQNYLEIIVHTCDDNRINLLNKEEKSDAAHIHYINETNYISMNDDDNLSCEKYSS